MRILVIPSIRSLTLSLTLCTEYSVCTLDDLMPDVGHPVIRCHSTYCTLLYLLYPLYILFPTLYHPLYPLFYILYSSLFIEM